MERLTLACLQHLPSAVLFVADLTGDCGTTVANQWLIRCACRWGAGVLLGGSAKPCMRVQQAAVRCCASRSHPPC